MKDYMRKINRPVQNTFFQDLFYFPKTDCCQSSDTHIHTHYIYPKQSVSTFGMP